MVFCPLKQDCQVLTKDLIGLYGKIKLYDNFIKLHLENENSLHTSQIFLLEQSIDFCCIYLSLKELVKQLR